jgi:hypothetical protein
VLGVVQFTQIASGANQVVSPDRTQIGVDVDESESAENEATPIPSLLRRGHVLACPDN